MKSISKFFTVLIIALGATSAHAQQKTLKLQQLPSKAQIFIKNTFAPTDISYILEEREVFSKEYNVKLKNGTEIEFDSKGQWTEVDGKRVAVPAKIIPAKIVDHVNKSFPETQIVKIKKSNRKIEVELTNDLELEFNAKGDFVRIDD